MDTGMQVISTAADNAVFSRICIKYETQPKKEQK